MLKVALKVFPGGPSNAGVRVRSLVQVLRSHMPPGQKIKQRQYCNEVNKTLKNGPHQKNLKKKVASSPPRPSSLLTLIVTSPLPPLSRFSLLLSPVPHSPPCFPLSLAFLPPPHHRRKERPQGGALAARGAPRWGGGPFCCTSCVPVPEPCVLLAVWRLWHPGE